MLERQGLETVSVVAQHRQRQMIEDSIRKAFADFGECSEVRLATEFRGTLDILQKCSVGMFDQFESQICCAGDFTMRSMLREMRFESSRTTQTVVDPLEPEDLRRDGVDALYASYAFTIAAYVRRQSLVPGSLGGGDPSDSIFQAATLALQGGQSARHSL